MFNIGVDMKKYVVLVMMVLAWSFGLKAQDEETVPTEEAAPVEEVKFWTKSASFGFNVTNVGLSNWAGGGENSFAIGSLVKANATYSKGHITWLNTFEAGYGLVRQGEIKDFRKSDDRLIAVSKWSKAFGESPWALTTLLDFRTQMTNGYNYSVDDLGVQQKDIISRLLAPGYLALSVGAEYKPNNTFYVMASPVSGKLTFVMDEALSNLGSFGVDVGKTLRKELGAIINLRYSKEIAKNINYETKLNLFQAYRKGAMVDMMWDNLLQLKVNDFISSTISAQMIYDEDVLFTNEDGSLEPRLQSKYVFNVGFLFSI